MINQNVQKTVGACCKKFREEKLKITQRELADEIGYSKETISAFENGRNNNNLIFLSYVKRGLLSEYTIEDLVGW